MSKKTSVLFGFILFVAAFVALIWNEYPATEMFKAAQEQNVWSLRAFAFCSMFFGLLMVFESVALFAGVPPRVGAMLGAASVLFAFVIAVALSLVSIAVLWIRFQPLLGITLLALAAGALFWLVQKGRAKMAQSKEQIIVGSPQAWPSCHGMPLPGSLTHSDIVLLACDRFAPLPPGSTGLWARIGGEVNFAWPFALGLLFCVGLFFGESRDSAAEGLLLRCVAAAGAVALLAGYWWGRRREDTASMMLPADTVFPLAGDRAALGEPLVAALVSAALLANERAGVLRLELRNGALQAEPTGAPAPWPADSLEDRIRRDRPNTVAGLVSDWLAHGSYSPHRRARRLAEHGAALRGLAAHSAGAAIDPAETLGLLQRCQDQRPEVWQALQQAVAEGVGARQVEPRYEQHGRVMVPVYDYQEPPVWLLDAPQEIAVEAVEVGAAEAKEPEPSQRGSRLVGLIAVLVLAAGTVIRLRLFGDEAWEGAPVAGLVSAISMIILIRVCRAREHRPPTASPHWIDEVLSGLLFGALVALIGALFGWGWMTAVLALLGLLVWGVRAKQRTLKAQDVVAAIQSRLLAVGTHRAGASSDESVEVPNAADISATQPVGQVSNIPVRLVAADDLPAPAEAERELLDRPAQRRRALRRLYWWGLATLIGGYSLIALAAEPRLGDSSPLGLIFACGFTAMVLIFFAREGAWDPAEDPDDDALRPFLLAPGIALWRLFALANSPFLDRKGFTLLALAFLTGHWLWMRWALARMGRRFPVPQPLRMSMLRVFGSPAFDDLIALIKPWRRVGLIEHLEGFDTIGESEEARAALRAGRIDDVLAKTGDEVERRLAAQSSAPDDTLLFGRYAFQCTEATWRPAIRRMLDRADVVLMDLSSLSPTNPTSTVRLSSPRRTVGLGQAFVTTSGGSPPRPESRS